VSHIRGAHRAAPPLGASPRTWRPMFEAWFAWRPGRPRGRHAVPSAGSRRRQGAYAVAGVTALTLGGSMTFSGELPAMAQAAALTLSGAAPADGLRENAQAAAQPPQRAVPMAVWLADQVHAARDAERAAALARAQAQAKAAEQAKATYAAAVAAAQADPQGTARTLAAQRGWTGGEYTCLQTLWHKESTWRYTATNPSSGAYGIPQALPAEKMATVAADWRTNPVTQMTWGLGYIKSVYGTPCSALNFHYANNWY
jgi:colicin import membrane protein